MEKLNTEPYYPSGQNGLNHNTEPFCARPQNGLNNESTPYIRPMKHSKQCNGYHTTCTTCEQMNICISEFGAAEQCDGCIKLDDIITK